MVSCNQEDFSTKFIKDNLKKKVKIDANTVIYKHNTYDYDEFRKKYPYITLNYIQEGCDVCYAKAYEWNKKKRLIPQDIHHACLFVFKGNDFNAFIKRAIGNDEFPFFIIIDNFNFLVKNKHIPREIIDNSVLIDSKNRIRVIGEPFNSPEANFSYKKFLNN
jgi:hypothetical protein